MKLTKVSEILNQQMNLSFGKCNGKKLSEKVEMGNWGTE